MNRTSKIILTALEREMLQWPQMDCCISADGYAVSQHDYRYAAGIGDAWSVKVQSPSGAWHGMSAYHYGLGKPHYPVPAIYVHPHLDDSRFMHWTFQGWLGAQNIWTYWNEGTYWFSNR